ncbi:MAG: pathogenicity locus [Candidatus Altiarchaeota archaeon]|nr:pathogenicity locus [Candidatus Altiarchaeota archaeon]
MSGKQITLKEFQQIPGVGGKIAEDLWSMGFRSAGELKNKDPEKLYSRLCTQKEDEVDRCMLYVLRCAVYYVSNTEHDPKLLKWWNWKNKELRWNRKN